MLQYIFATEYKDGYWDEYSGWVDETYIRERDGNLYFKDISREWEFVLEVIQMFHYEIIFVNRNTDSEQDLLIIYDTFLELLDDENKGIADSDKILAFCQKVLDYAIQYNLGYGAFTPFPGNDEPLDWNSIFANRTSSL